MTELLRNARKTISTGVTIVTAGYFVAVCVVVVILISPIFLARKLDKQLSMAK